MKITFLLPHIKISGGVKALLEYANRLRGRGHDVLIAIPAPEPKWYRWDEKLRLRRAGAAPVVARELDWFNNAVPAVRVPQLTAEFLPDADILVASAWQTAESAGGLPPSKGRAFYFVQHHESLWTREKERAENTYRLPLGKVVISSWLGDVMKNEYGQTALVLVTPVNATEFYCAEKKINRPRRICLLHHDYAWKGFAEALAALRLVRGLGFAIEPVVFGEKMRDPRALFDQAGFEFEYHFRPTGERLRDIYSSCDIYLCASWFEGLGMPAMEAMACRCALVTSDTGGSRDYAIHDETALVSPARDVNGLARNLAQLLDDEATLLRLAENGRRKIGEFHWDDNCRRLEKMFEETLRGQAA
jgi:hypothetical protein